MEMKIKVCKNILSIKPYVSGKPIEEVEREYGIRDSIKLASNENPLGVSPKALEAVENAARQLNRYPEVEGRYLVEKLASKLDVLPENIVLGAGSNEILEMLACTLLDNGDEAIMTKPSFHIYDIVVKKAGAESTFVPLNQFKIDFRHIKDKISPLTRMIFITNPNNPTSTVVSDREFKNFIKDVPENIVIVIDEAYIEFVREKDCLKSFKYLNCGHPIVITRTFSKAYGLAGARIGYGVMHKELADLLHRIRLPFNVNSFAQAAAAAALDDIEFLNKTVKLVHNEIDSICSQLDAMNISYIPTQTNFLFINLKIAADDVFETMLREGVIVRSMRSYGYPNCIRINVGLHEENLKFLSVLDKILNKD
mmetsp:Transcript_797/g.599  ORF Transcript_797/g.599 Transcript_797/m.599 type:complete len:367 (-) Transcript_797:588-1688(-)